MEISSKFSPFIPSDKNVPNIQLPTIEDKTISLPKTKTKDLLAKDDIIDITLKQKPPKSPVIEKLIKNGTITPDQEEKLKNKTIIKVKIDNKQMAVLPFLSKQELNDIKNSTSVYLTSEDSKIYEINKKYMSKDKYMIVSKDGEKIDFLPTKPFLDLFESKKNYTKENKNTPFIPTDIKKENSIQKKLKDKNITKVKTETKYDAKPKETTTLDTNNVAKTLRQKGFHSVGSGIFKLDDIYAKVVGNKIYFRGFEI